MKNNKHIINKQMMTLLVACLVSTIMLPSCSLSGFSAGGQKSESFIKDEAVPLAAFANSFSASNEPNQYEHYGDFDLSDENYSDEVLLDAQVPAALYFDLSKAHLGLIAINLDNVNPDKIRVTIHKQDIDFQSYKNYLTRPYYSGWYPMTDGSGVYVVTMYVETTQEGSFQSFYSVGIEANFEEISPFYYANIFSFYKDSSPLSRKAAELTGKIESSEEKIQRIAAFINENIEYEKLYYDEDGEYGDADLFYERGAGVCYHYSAIFSAMAKSIGIPAREVRGTATGADDVVIYHSWNEYYLDGEWKTVDCQNFGRAEVILNKEPYSER